MSTSERCAPGPPLRLLAGAFAICRLPPSATVPAWAWSGPLASVTRSEDELSIVCTDAAVPPAAERVERDWRALVVAGPLDVDLVGVLAGLTAALAAAGVSVFALSTFDTDYLLVRARDLERAVAALRQAGRRVDAAPP